MLVKNLQQLRARDISVARQGFSKTVYIKLHREVLLIQFLVCIEFWEHHFECKFVNSPNTPYNLGYDKYCTGDEELENIKFEDQLQYVSDAVMSFAHAVRYAL